MGNSEELTTWKQIASFLGVAVRTAQKWERERGLPVRRLPGGKNGLVAATAGDLQAWKEAAGEDPTSTGLSAAPAEPPMQMSVSDSRVSAATIAEQLDRILASPGFSSSPKLRRMLAYLTNESLAGRGSDLKEYSIALAVFDRDESFDPRLETVVRVQARRLRTQLEVYFHGIGIRDPLEIRIPKGGYAPEFIARAQGDPSRRIWKWQWWLLPAAALAVALLPWLWRRPGVPAIWAYEGNTLRISDSDGRLCWSRRFADLNILFEPEYASRVLIEDIDDDGRMEVLASVNRVQPAINRSSLICFEQDGRQRWEARYGAVRTFGGRLFTDSYHGRPVGMVSSAGRRLVLALAAHYLWYPSQVVLLDPRTGQTVSEYWHPGRVYEALPCDVDGDGSAEILFAAINNPGEGLGHAALGVLKLPLPPPRQWKPGGGELAYILLPTPDVCRAAGKLPAPFGLAVDGLGRIQVSIPLPEAGVIVYNLDFALNVLEHRASHDLASIHERLRKQGLLDHELNSSEFQELGNAVRFAEAPEGNSPDVERHWAPTSRSPKGSVPRRRP